MTLRRNRLLPVFSLALLLAAAALLTGSAQVVFDEVKVEEKPHRMPDGRGGHWNVTRHLIPLDEMRGGGPPKDGIPALTNPDFLSTKEADERLRDDDRLIGLEFSGQAKAYPIRILNWHEIVNDTVSGRAVAVTW